MKAIDTSVLIAAERDKAVLEKLTKEKALFVPAMAAAEFLVGIRAVKKLSLWLRAQDVYDDHYKPYIFAFTESQAQTLASLIVENTKRGRQMKMFDAAIAATAIDLACPLIVADSDFDHLTHVLHLERL